jgi:hypothetical protein
MNSINFIVKIMVFWVMAPWNDNPEDHEFNFTVVKISDVVVTNLIT